MVKFMHTLHIDDVEGNEAVSLQYTGEIPFAPSLGLVVELSRLVSFKIESGVIYSVPDKSYKTVSVVKYNPLDHEPGEDSKFRYIAGYIKNGFVLWDSKDLCEDSISKIEEYSSSGAVLA